MNESVSIVQSFHFLFRDDAAVKNLLPSYQDLEGNCVEAETLINVQLNSHELKDSSPESGTHHHQLQSDQKFMVNLNDMKK